MRGRAETSAPWCSISSGSLGWIAFNAAARAATIIGMRIAAHRLARRQDGPIAPVQRHRLPARASFRLRGIGGRPLPLMHPQRHHEPRRAEAALGAVFVDHRPLHRMQRFPSRARASTGEQRPPVQRRGEQDAGVHRLETAPRHHPAPPAPRCRRRNRPRRSLPCSRSGPGRSAARSAPCGPGRYATARGLRCSAGSDLAVPCLSCRDRWNNRTG